MGTDVDTFCYQYSQKYKSHHLSRCGSPHGFHYHNYDWRSYFHVDLQGKPPRITDYMGQRKFHQGTLSCMFCQYVPQIMIEHEGITAHTASMLDLQSMVQHKFPHKRYPQDSHSSYQGNDAHSTWWDYLHKNHQGISKRKPWFNFQPNRPQWHYCKLPGTFWSYYLHR